MRKLILLIMVVLVVGVSLHGQTPQGEFRGYFQNVSNFDFQSGSPSFDISGEGFNGGGFGFVFNLNDWLGFFTETNFLTGVEQGSLSLKLINQSQGIKVTARELGPVNVYAKGGIGFSRFLFDTGSGETIRYQTGFSTGGGVDFRISDPMAFFVEGNLLTFSLPNITNVSDRDKWDSSLGTSVGVAFFF